MTRCSGEEERAMSNAASPPGRPSFASFSFISLKERTRNNLTGRMSMRGQQEGQRVNFETWINKGYFCLHSADRSKVLDVWTWWKFLWENVFEATSPSLMTGLPQLTIRQSCPEPSNVRLSECCHDDLCLFQSAFRTAV